MLIRSLIVLIVTTSFCLANAKADDDPIREKFNAAKATYEKDMEYLKKDINAWFDKQDEIARNDGNKKLVDLIRENRQKFEERGDFSLVGSAPLKQKNAAIRAAMEATYRQTIKEFTKAKKDDDAALLEKELIEFKVKASSMEELEKSLLGVWRVRFFDNQGKETFRAEWTFRKDGTMISTAGSPKGRWNVEKEKNRIYMKWEGDEDPWVSFNLPLDPNKTEGDSSAPTRMQAKKIK